MKVVIIGGGPSALAAAYELTESGRGDHEVTILQPGWRLGGKCASGRNRADGNRIEEHGLHIWFGSYDNAITLMTRCYEQLGRDPQRYAFTSFDDAFEGVDEAILWQRHDDRWTFKQVRFPQDPQGPRNFQSFAVRALDWAVGRLAELTDAHRDEGVERHDDLPSLLLRFGINRLDEPSFVGLISRAGSRFQRLMGRAFSDVETDLGVEVVDLADEFEDMARWVLLRYWRDDHEVRFYLDTLGILLAVIRGVWDDELLSKGFDTINEVDFAEWLCGHGLELGPDPESWPALLRALYCGCFAFEKGDVRRPRMAAGRALQGAIRCVFHYQGSVLHRMRGAMGDTVIAPFYEVLKERGVDVRFFCAAKELRPDGAGAIGEIRCVHQLGRDAPYEPLFDAGFKDADGVRTVPAWPSTPLWEQLPHASQEARQAPLRLEQEVDPFGGTEFTLRRRSSGDTADADNVFDLVILAVPPDVQEEICGALKFDRPYADMLTHSHTVVTQGSQLWLEADARQLAQPFGSRTLMSTWVEPLDTYCDMAHLLPNEQWPETDHARHIAYFCGVLPEAELPDQAAADVLARTHLQDLIASYGTRLWPSAAAPGGRFRYDLLAPRPDRLEPPASFNQQFWRGNFAPTERYVLSLPKTVAYRLPARGTGFCNLVLAGDWTRNSFDAGCLEAAITSGMLASHAICGQPPLEQIAGLDGPPGFPNRPPGGTPDRGGGGSAACGPAGLVSRTLSAAVGAGRAVVGEVRRLLGGL